MKLPEVWLSSLVCLKAGVIRVGLTDTFSPAPPSLPGSQRRDWRCSWADKAAVWGLSQHQEEQVWRRMTGKTPKCAPALPSYQQENQCNA